MALIPSITSLIILLMVSASIALSTGALDPATVSGVVTSGQRVDTSLHPQWAGVMHPDDCAKARALFGGRVAFYNPHWLMVFWSRRWTVQPKGGYAFELPFGFRYKSCTLLVRMAKDYGDDVIFSGETPVHYAGTHARSFESWFHISETIDLLLGDVRLHDKPLWGYLTDIVVLFVPSSSAISKRWSAGMRSSRGYLSEE